MGLSTKTHQNKKNARIHEEWPKVPDKVFEQLGVTRKDLKKLEGHLVGHILLPGMRGYNKSRVSDGIVPHMARPLIIVNCAVFRDVWHCLQWANKYNWWVTCRSGGHSTAGYSVNTGMVIDVSAISYVCVDAEQKQARVGAGTRFIELNATLDTYGLHVPGGACNDVAVGGYMQGGGYGYTSREYGIQCDNVLSVTVMLYDGSIVVANKDKNADLFWAIRGGTGNNFGVLLEITYQLHELREVWGFCLSWPIEEGPRALKAMQDHFMKDGGPPQLGYMGAITFLPQSDQPSAEQTDGVDTTNYVPAVAMMGMYHHKENNKDGKHREGRKAIEPLMNVLEPLLAVGHCTLNYTRRGTYDSLNEALIDMLPGIPLPIERTKEAKTSGYIQRRLSHDDWQRIIDYYVTTKTKLNNIYNIVFIEPYGGAIESYPADGNAFIHRKPYMNFYIDSFWQDHEEFTKEGEAVEWLAGFAEVMAPFFDGHVYQNYPVRSNADFRWAYWGDVYNSLLFVKRKYDPNNFFHFEQSISPYPNDPDIKKSDKPSRFSDPKIEREPYSRSFLWDTSAKHELGPSLVPSGSDGQQ